nr:ORF1 [Rhodnius prolixus virus 1]
MAPLKIKTNALIQAMLGIIKPKPKKRPNKAKIDFRGCLTIAEQHERDVKFLKKEEAWRRTKAVRYNPNVPQIVIEPSGSTYAEVVASYGGLCKEKPIKIRAAEVAHASCDCKACKLALQAKKAKTNAFLKREKMRILRKELAALRRRLRRVSIPQPKLKCFMTFGGVSYHSLYDVPCTCGRCKEVEIAESMGVGIARPTSKKSVKTSWRELEQWPNLEVIEQQPFLGLKTEKKAVRSPVLLMKLRSVIRSFRQVWAPIEEGVEQAVAVVAPEDEGVECLSSIPTSTVEKLPTMYVEMDGDTPHSVQESQASNVVIQDAQNVAEENIGAGFRNLTRYCEANVSKYEEDMGRWQQLYKGSWSVSSEITADLSDHILPQDLVVATHYDASDEGEAKLRKNVPANALRVRQFVHTDIELQITLNGTPFYQGQLIAAWFYRPDLDANFSLREHVCSYSYTNHCIIDAGNSNSARMYIPYRSYRPYLNTRIRNFMDTPLNLGQLRIRPLVKLQAVSGCSTDLDYTIMARFVNCTLSGMVPPTLSFHNNFETEMLNMLPAAIEASKILYNAWQDRNRDKPPTDLQPPHVIPVATSCMANGRGVGDAVQSMRLDPLGQTPHPELLPNEMSVSHVARQWGFIKTITLSTVMNDLFYCVDAAPMMDLKDYQYTETSGVKAYYLPPVAAISQLYSYWAGTIEYRLDFVATRYHQARLWMCWVPNYLGKMKYDDAVNCAGTYFDLKEDNRSVIVQIPYIADRPMWPHRYSTGVIADEYEAPSQFCIYIVNKLSCTSAIASSISVNVYVRGGSDFTVAVPCQPSVGLPFNAQFKGASDTEYFARAGYYPYYAGTWNSVVGGTKLVLRYGPVTQHIAQFDGLTRLNYYKIADDKLGSTMIFKDNVNKTYTANDVYFVPINVNDGLGYAYLGVIHPTDINSYYYKYDSKKKSYVTLSTPNYSALMLAGDTTGNTYYQGSSNPKLLRTWVFAPTEPPIETEALEENVISFESPPAMAPSRILFGEEFMDLKDLCRRYQYYDNTIIRTRVKDMGRVVLKFPALPQGLELHPMTDPVDNAIRDGPIPLVCSAFRFYRGGLRFKIIVNSGLEILYAVQARPDRTFRGPHISMGGSSKTDDLYNHGYAMTLQYNNINPITTIEVPMYLAGSCGLLQMPTSSAINNAEVSRFFSLAEVSVLISDPRRVMGLESSITTFYSVADDFVAHTFQGFPPLIMIREGEEKGGSYDAAESYDSESELSSSVSIIS